MAGPTANGGAGGGGDAEAVAAGMGAGARGPPSTAAAASPPAARGDRADTPLAVSVFAALFFATTSIALVFVNKWGITLFPLTNAILLLQLVLTLLLFAAKRAADGPAGASFPAWDPATARTAAPLAAVYLGNIVFSLMSLKGLNLPMYLVLRRNTPLACMLLKRLLFGGDWPSRPVGLSVLVVCAGSIVAGYSALDFDLRSYSMAIGSCFLQATYMLLVEMKTRPPATAAQVAEVAAQEAAAVAAAAAAKAEGGGKGGGSSDATSSSSSRRQGMYYQPNTHPLTEGEMLHYNSLLSLPAILLIALATGELSAAPRAAAEAVARSSTLTLAVALLGCAGGGLLLNYATMLCTSTNSALTTTVVGVLKGVVGTLGGLFTSRGSFSSAGVVGVLMNTAGGVAYSWAKFEEKRAKKAAKAAAEGVGDGRRTGKGGGGGGKDDGWGAAGGGGSSSPLGAAAHRAARSGGKEEAPLLG
jgi:solute carrier family 35 protein